MNASTSEPSPMFSPLGESGSFVTRRPGPTSTGPLEARTPSRSRKTIVRRALSSSEFACVAAILGLLLSVAVAAGW